MSWIEQLMKDTEGVETPRSFIFWAGMVAISAVAKRNVYLNKFAYKLYPNIYVMLVAKSGSRKGYAVDVAKRLVRGEASSRIISGRSSIEAIIKELATARSEPGRPPITEAQALIASQELATLLVKSDYATDILTDLYDTHANDEWTNTLKGSGTEKLKNVCLTMIGASNETLFRETVPAHAHKGGFLARNLVVIESKRALKNALVDAPISVLDVSKLVPYLKKVAETKGEFTWEPAAKKHYKDWYNAWEPETMDDETGTSDRIHDQILKVAMLLSLARDTTLSLTLPDIKEAIEKCKGFMVNAKKLTAGSGKSAFAPQTAVVLQELLSQPDLKISRTKLLQKHWGQFNAQDLDQIIETMVQMGAVKQITENDEIVYKLHSEIAKQYQSLTGK